MPPWWRGSPGWRPIRPRCGGASRPGTGCWSRRWSVRVTRCCRSTRSWRRAAAARPARRKTTPRTPGSAASLALDRHAGLRRLIPHGETGAELRSIARDDERACRDERRLLDRLRADLIVTFPAALAIAAATTWAPRDAAAAGALAHRPGAGRGYPRGDHRVRPRAAHRLPAALRHGRIRRSASPKTSSPRPRTWSAPRPSTIRLAARQLLPTRRAAAGRGETDGRATLLGAPGPARRGGPAGEGVSWRRDLPEHSRPRSPSRRQDRR